MDLSTGYMGLALRNPLVASPSPLSHTLDGIRRLADGGVGAIVMFSLFEEQLRERAARTYRLVDEPAESFPEALGYFPSVAGEDVGPRGYLDLLERAVSAVDIPVIASLNGITPESWTGYARAMQDAGAAAIELNIYYFPADPEVSGPDVEQRHVDVFRRVKAAVTVPVAVKLKPYFSSPGAIALRLDEAGPTGSCSSIASSTPTSTSTGLWSGRWSTSRARPMPGFPGPGSPCCAAKCAPRSRRPPAWKSPATSSDTYSPVPTS